MRRSPDYTDENRRALPPADDDLSPVWQKGSDGVYSLRNVARNDAEKRMIEVVTQSRADLTAQIQTMVAQQAALLAELAARKQLIALPDVTVTANQLITLTAGEQAFTNLPCAGVRTTDTIFVAGKIMPAGTGVRGWSIPANGRINLTVQRPILTIGGTELVVSVTAFR